MKKTVFTGAGCAIVTPFHPDGSLNTVKFEELIERQLAGKTDAIIVMGTTGEASALDDPEHLQAIEVCVKTVAGRVPVVAGCGSNNTQHAIKLSKEAEKLGADALLHVTPYYNKTSQRGLVQHFTVIAESVSIPIILYNVPSRTGMTIQPQTYVELAKIPNIVGTKEASGDISAIAKVAALCGEDFSIYSGNDDQIVPILSLGGKGVISVLSNVVPEKIHTICAQYLEGNVRDSARGQLEILDLNDAMFCDVNPIPVKEALNQMGLEAGQLLMPLFETSDANKAKIAAALRACGALPEG